MSYETFNRFVSVKHRVREKKACERRLADSRHPGDDADTILAQFVACRLEGSALNVSWECRLDFFGKCATS
jgi:hypothetical protein